MLRRRLSIFRVHFRGRGGSWLALLGQVIALIGLPLPVAAAKDLSNPFPCQHRLRMLERCGLLEELLLLFGKSARGLGARP